MFVFFQAEDGIRDAQESRGLGDVYKRQIRRIWSSWGLWDNLRCAWAFGRKMFPTKAAARRALTFVNKANDKALDKY